MIAVIAVLVVAVLIRTTVFGRRFVAVGASPAAARAAGIPVTASLITTYVVASLSFGVSGILSPGTFRLRAYRPARITCSRRSRRSYWVEPRSRVAPVASWRRLSEPCS